jgi:hypothetical protein
VKSVPDMPHNDLLEPPRLLLTSYMSRSAKTKPRASTDATRGFRSSSEGIDIEIRMKREAVTFALKKVIEY